MDKPVTIVIDNTDKNKWFVWVCDENHEEGGVTLGYVPTLTQAVKKSDELGFTATHWQYINGTLCEIPANIVRKQK